MPTEGPVPLASPLYWAGSKAWLVSLLRPAWQRHRHRRLVELFCGSAAVSFGLRPERALLNDLNPHVANFFRQLQRGLYVTIRMDNDPALFLRYRRLLNRLHRGGHADTPLAAQVFYFLMRTCYRGLCRLNARGEFNAPFGYRRDVPLSRDLRAYAAVMREWEVTCLDFRQVLLEPEDFVYADPPHDGTFQDYVPGGFSWRDQVDLARLLAGHPGPVVASNRPTGRVLDLYQRLGFRVLLVPAGRPPFGEGGRPRTVEVLALRNLDLEEPAWRGSPGTMSG